MEKLTESPEWYKKLDAGQRRMVDAARELLKCDDTMIKLNEHDQTSLRERR